MSEQVWPNVPEVLKMFPDLGVVGGSLRTTQEANLKHTQANPQRFWEWRGELRTGAAFPSL